MKYSTRNGSFTDQNGKVVNYTQCVVNGVVAGVSVSVTIVPFDNSKFAKDYLKNYAGKAELIVHTVNGADGSVKDKVTVEFPDGNKMDCKVSAEGMYLLKILNKSTLIK